MTEKRYRVDFTDEARRQLRKLENSVRARIIRAVAGLESDPRPDGVKKLKGAKNKWRIRIGDWRVVYEIEDGRLVVLVVVVAHRSKAYKER